MGMDTDGQVWAAERANRSNPLRRMLRRLSYGLLKDEELVQRTRARDFAAFDALVARYRDRLYTLAVASLKDENEAILAMRDTVLSAFRDLDSFNDRCSPGTWLYLHGIRAVFARLGVPPGRYTFEDRSDEVVANEA